MELAAFFLMGLGGLALLIILGLAIFELIRIPLIRAPRKQDYATMRREDRQFREILVPSLAALGSGVFVSISASYFYESLNNQENVASTYYGIGFFAFAAIIFSVMLYSALKSKGADDDLSQDPTMIAAAARERAVNLSGRAPDSSYLDKRLKEWGQVKYAHAVGVFRGVSLRHRGGGFPYLRVAFVKAGSRGSVLRLVAGPLRIFAAMVWHFPLNFIWPLLGGALLPLGVIVFLFLAVDDSVLSEIIIFAVFTLISLVIVGSYAWLRGVRARKAYLINEELEREAGCAVAMARRAEEKAADYVEQKRMRNENLDSFLARQGGKRGRKVLLKVSLGPFCFTVSK
ncbi:hypothetical protein [Kocuria sp.]|uniref:hypothetical protein n=1 Tax=Kocuria sp. TaxID=1871328 RepID=UPI0026E03BC0|nr:hypothetical protein [Kocuria sp.]MDO5617852.1 hypothetical protein [Kocuria sp.]